MATMDLSVDQELMRVQRRYDGEYGSHVFKLQQPFQGTDITGNNSFFNSLKTETNENHVCNPNPRYQVKSKNDNQELVVENSLFSYSSFKRAMDLRIHNRTEEGEEGVKRTIFEDAEYFARNCCYKLLPISFEQVDETIIQTEHNYSLFSLESESEREEDCSRTMDYSQVREKNYKKRKTKMCEKSDHEEGEVNEKCRGDSVQVTIRAGDDVSSQTQNEQPFTPPCEDGPFAGQPLDLSAPPEQVQQNKTEAPVSIPEEAAQPDSDKENACGEVSGIRVTITRPDERNSYQPCDSFLNDIARLVPWLIDKDCLEVDILDRTCDRHRDFRKHRLYYVISESTWRFFQSTNERIILTNDRSLGQPLRKAEREDRPSYLVFDQFSLAKCLAEYCQEIGGCFEYTCVEEGRERILETVEEKEKEDRKGGAVNAEQNLSETEKVAEEGRIKAEKEEKREETVDVGKILEGIKRGDNLNDDEVIEETKEENEEESKKSKDSVEEKTPVDDVRVADSELENIPKGNSAKEGAKRNFVVLEGVKKYTEKFSSSKTTKKVNERRKRKAKSNESKGKRERSAPNEKQKEKLKEPEDPRIMTRSKSTSEVKTSQESDKSLGREERKKRRQVMTPTDEPPNKRRRAPNKPEEMKDGSRRWTSVLSEAKRTSASSEKPEKKGKKDEKGEKAETIVTKRSLRSQGSKVEEKEKEKRKVKEKKKGKGEGKSVSSGKYRKR